MLYNGVIFIENNNLNYSDKDILQYALANGMINMDLIQDKIAMEERKQYLAKHSFKKWQGNNGKWYTYLPDESCKSNRRLVKKSSEDSLDDAIVEFYKTIEQKVFIKDLFYLWAIEKLDEFGEISKQTYDRYETDFYRFFEKSELYDIEFKKITENMLEKFIKTTINKQELSAKGWGNLRTLIKGIFKYARKHGHTQISIYEFLGNLELSPNIFKKVYKLPEEQVFTQKEIDMIITHIYEHPISMVSIGIIFAFQTGLRAGEIAGLKYSDFDGESITLKRTEIRYKDKNGNYVFEVRNDTKGKDGIRKVVLTDSAIKTLQQAHRLNPFGEYLFMRDGYRIKGKSYTNKIYRICDSLGIPRRSIHKARKTYGTKLLNAGIDEKLIESQMGHNDIKTTIGHYWYNNHEKFEVKKVLTAVIG